MSRGIRRLSLLLSLLGVAAVAITSNPLHELPPPLVDASVGVARVLVEDTFAPDEQVVIADEIEKVTDNVEAVFDRRFQPPPRVFVYATAASFARGVGDRFDYSGTTAQYVGATYSGIFDRGSLAIAINWSSVPADRMSAVVTHELVHLMLDEATDGVPLPTWFDEGLATIFEQQFSATANWTPDEVLAGRALAGTGLVTLNDLALLAEWHDTYARFGRPLYAFAAEAVHTVEVRVGWDGISRVVRAVRDGTPFEAAYQGEADETIAQLWARLRAGATPTILVGGVADADGDRTWTLYTGRPGAVVLVSIARPLTGYLVTFTVTTDELGLYRGSFGSTVSPGAYTIVAEGLEAVVVTSR